MSVVNTHCPLPVDAPVLADGVRVLADWASRGRGHSLLTYSQAGVMLTLEAIATTKSKVPLP